MLNSTHCPFKIASPDNFYYCVIMPSPGVRVPRILILTFLLHAHTVHLAHIVFLHTASSYSHRVPQWPLVLALVENGHNVTFISGYAGGSEMSHPNVTDINVPQVKDVMDYILSKFDINYRINGVAPGAWLALEPASYLACSALHHSPTFQSWLNTTSSIDLIYTDTNPECGFGLASKFGSKHAIFQTLPFMPKNFEGFGISSEEAVPTWTLCPGRPTLSFFSRVLATVEPLLGRMVQIITYNFAYKPLFKETLELDPPQLYDMEASTSLLLINGDYLEDYARSYPPFVVKLPGMHIQKGNVKEEKLDPELEAFISSPSLNGTTTVANNGFIYISFGTVATASSLPDSFRGIFFRCIQAFPNIHFIWRWKGLMPKSYPANLIFLPWVNQQMLLAHPKIKGFITQAGRPSMQEAFYHGVPTIAFPILADQDFNAYRYEHLGTAVTLDIARLSQPDLMNVINRTVTDSKWLSHVKAMSSLGKDVPLPPVQVALWWTEFVLRHTPEELRLLKPLAQQLTWFQRRQLDVWAVIGFLSAGITLVLYKLSAILLFKMGWFVANKNKSKLE